MFPLAANDLNTPDTSNALRLDPVSSRETVERHHVSTGRKNSALHRRRQSIRHRQIARLRYRLQEAFARVPVARLSGARFLLHRGDRGSGIFLDPAADRLARLT